MLVCEQRSTSTSSSSRHQEYADQCEYQAAAAPPPPEQAPQQPPPQQQQLDLALEGRSILLQQRAPSHPSTPHPGSPAPAHPPQHRAPPADAKTFSPLQLQLRIDLHSEQGVDVPGRLGTDAQPGARAQQHPLSRRQRAQLRRRQEQQKPADQVVYQRRTPARPRTPAACPRIPLVMSTMSMPAAGQKFAADDAAASVFGSAEETSAAVKRLLAKSGASVIEDHRVISSSTKTTSATSTMDYLQDSFDFLHQRHMKNLSSVISRHQQQQQQQLQAPSQDEQTSGLSQSQTSSQRHKKQVHIHQSAFYDGQSGLGLSDDNNMQQPSTFKSTKTINLTNNNSSNSSSSDLEDAKMLQQQQIQQQRRCVRENSTSSLQSQSSVSSAHSFDNFNNNFADALSLSNKSNTTKVSSKSSTTSSSTSSCVQQSFSSSKKQIIKQSFSSSSMDFDDRMGIDVMLTPSGAPSTPGTPTGVVALSSPNLNLAAAASTTKSKVKQTTKVTSSVMSSSSNSDQPEECKQSVKTFKAKTVKKSVSDGRQVHTDVDKHTETAEEEAEGSLEKPVITFSHVSSEGSHQSFTDNIVRFDSSTLSSPSRSRSPSPLLEMPAPYNDLSKEIKRPPMEKA